jgi:phosphatidylserine decarboxylase
VADEVAALVARAGLPADLPREPLSGGDVSRVVRVGPAVVKHHPGGPVEFVGGPHPRGMFASEAAGLRQLGAAGVPVPAVRWVDDDGIVLDDLGEGPEDWPALGRAVARLHADRAERYGADPPLFIATVELPTGWSADWPALYREQRIEPLLGSLDPARAARVRTWLDRQDLPREGASLVHGDLWRGNVVFGARGPALIDPSAQRAERALDLAMIALFGGFPEAFHRAYREVLPVPAEVERSLPAYQLYFLLVHVRLFGDGYLPAVDRILSG